MQAITSASPACTARAARRNAITPLAPPNGTDSSQRSDRPSERDRLATGSGGSVKLDTARPSRLSFARPARASSSRRHCATYQSAGSVL
ncbi:hypothetical protein D9M72_228500 [compost metagenome]